MAQRGDLVQCGRLVTNGKWDDDDSSRRKRQRSDFYDYKEERRMERNRERARKQLALLSRQWIYIQELLGVCPDVQRLVTEQLAFFGLYRCCRIYRSVTVIHRRRDSLYLLPVTVDLEEFSLKIVATLNEYDRYYRMDLSVERVAERFGDGTGIQLAPLTDPMTQIGSVPFNAHSPTSIYVDYETLSD